MENFVGKNTVFSNDEDESDFSGSPEKFRKFIANFTYAPNGCRYELYRSIK
jgi:hypothetical protein